MKTRRIKASRTAKSRRRISASSRFSRATRPVRASRRIRAARQEIIDYLNFSELNDEQREQAVQVFIESGRASEWYSDDEMMWYEENLHEMARDAERKSGLVINEKKLYWESNSQGPYPEWDLSTVFPAYDGGSFDIYFYGRGTDVEAQVTTYREEDGDWVFDADYDETDAPDFAMNIINVAQQFIDKVCDYIDDVCNSYPDDDWCYETLEANDYEFRVDSDGDVIGMA